MIVEERMVTYIRSLEVPESAVIEAIEQEALRDRVPIIRKEMQSFLKVLLMIKRPMRILEVGAAVGFSSILMHGLEGPYDLIFVDAAKGQYIHYLPEVMRLLGTDGVLVSDNVLQEGDIIESRFAVERRNRTIHSRMREYLYELKHHDQLQTSIIPLGDGVALSVKRSDI